MIWRRKTKKVIVVCVTQFAQICLVSWRNNRGISAAIADFQSEIFKNLSTRLWLEDKNELFFVFELYIARRIHLEHKLTRVHEEKCKTMQGETPQLVRVSTEERGTGVSVEEKYYCNNFLCRYLRPTSLLPTIATKRERRDCYDHFSLNRRSVIIGFYTF